MPSNLEQVMSAIKAADKEREKLLKEWKAAKGPEKEKLKKMAAAAQKIALAHIDSIDAAKAKDKAAMLAGFKEMGL